MESKVATVDRSSTICPRKSTDSLEKVRIIGLPLALRPSPFLPHRRFGSYSGLTYRGFGALSWPKSYGRFVGALFKRLITEPLLDKRYKSKFSNWTRRYARPCFKFP